MEGIIGLKGNKKFRKKQETQLNITKEMALLGNI